MTVQIPTINMVQRFSITPYSLAGGIGEALSALSEKTKKDRGVGRELSRMLERLSAPSLRDHSNHQRPLINVVDFRMELRHQSVPVPGVKVPDWLSLAFHSQPLLRRTQFLGLMATQWVVKLGTRVASLCEGNPNFQEFRSLLVMRFERASFDESVTIMPVLSMVVPADIDSWTVERKLRYISVVQSISVHYEAQRLEQAIVEQTTFAPEQLNGYASEVFRDAFYGPSEAKLKCYSFVYPHLQPQPRYFTEADAFYRTAN